VSDKSTCTVHKKADMKPKTRSSTSLPSQNDFWSSSHRGQSSPRNGKLTTLRSSLLEGIEAQTEGLAAGVQAAMHAQGVQLLAAAAVDLQHLEEGRDVPDVEEGDLPKLGAPLHGDADTEAEGGDHVDQALAAVEAAVRVGPHAVDGADALRLSQDILKGDLDMVVDAVGVTVDEIDFGHCDG